MMEQKGGRGFTMLELMVAVAMVAVVVGMSLPAMYQFVVNMKTKSTARSVYNLLQQGRILAVREGKPVRVQFGSTEGGKAFSEVLLGIDLDGGGLSQGLNAQGDPKDDIRERFVIAAPVKAERKDSSIREVVFTPQGMISGSSGGVEIKNSQTPKGYAISVSAIGTIGMKGNNGTGGCS